MKAFWVLAALVLATGCKGKETPAVTAPSTPTPTALVPESALPTDAPVLEASEIAGDFKCGSFDTKKLEMTERGLLDDRVRTRFFPGAEAAGGAESGKLEATNGSTKVFVGARELFAQGDALFERRAAKQGLFGGDYDSMKIGTLLIVAGVLKENKPGRDMVALAHGWFLDPNSDVLDGGPGTDTADYSNGFPSPFSAPISRSTSSTLTSSSFVLVWISSGVPA